MSLECGHVSPGAKAPSGGAEGHLGEPGEGLNYGYGRPGASALKGGGAESHPQVSKEAPLDRHGNAEKAQHGAPLDGPDFTALPERISNFFDRYNETWIKKLSDELSSQEELNVRTRESREVADEALRERINLLPTAAHLNQRNATLVRWIMRQVRAGCSFALTEIPSAFDPMILPELPQRHYDSATRRSFKKASERGFKSEDLFLCRRDSARIKKWVDEPANIGERLSQFLLLKGLIGEEVSPQLLISNHSRVFNSGGRALNAAWRDFVPVVEGETVDTWDGGDPSVNRGMDPRLVLPGPRGGARGIAEFHAAQVDGKLHPFYHDSMKGELTEAEVTALLETANGRIGIDMRAARRARMPTLAVFAFDSKGRVDVAIGNDALNTIWPLAPELLSRGRFPLSAGVSDGTVYITLHRESYRKYIERAMALEDPIARRMMRSFLSRISTSGEFPDADDRSMWNYIVAKKAETSSLNGLREVADAGAKWIRLCIMQQALVRLSKAFEAQNKREFKESYAVMAKLAMVWMRRVFNGALSSEALPAFPPFLTEEIRRAGATLLNKGHGEGIRGTTVDGGRSYAPYDGMTMQMLAAIIDMTRLPVKPATTTVAEGERGMLKEMRVMNAVTVASQQVCLHPDYIAEMHRIDAICVEQMNADLVAARAANGPFAVPDYAPVRVRGTTNKANARNPRSGGGENAFDLELTLMCIQLGISGCPKTPGIASQLQAARVAAMEGSKEGIEQLGMLMEMIDHYMPFAEQFLIFEHTWDPVPDEEEGEHKPLLYPSPSVYEIEKEFEIHAKRGVVSLGFLRSLYPRELPRFAFRIRNGKKMIKPILSSNSSIAPEREGNSPQIPGVDNKRVRQSKLRSFAAIPVNRAARRLTPMAKAMHGRLFSEAEQVIKGPAPQIQRALEDSLARAKSLIKNPEVASANFFKTMTDGEKSTDEQSPAGIKLHTRKHTLAPNAFWGADKQGHLTQRGRVLRDVTLAGMEMAMMPMMLTPRCDMPPRMPISWMHLDDGVTQTQADEESIREDLSAALNRNVQRARRGCAGDDDASDLTDEDTRSFVENLIGDPVFQSLEAGNEFLLEILKHGTRTVALFPTSWGKSTRLVLALANHYKVLVLSPKGGAIVSAANDLASSSPNMLIRADAYEGPHKWEDDDYTTISSWDKGICIVTDSNARMVFRPNEFDVVIIDEAHKMRGVLGYMHTRHLLAVTASELGAKAVARGTKLPLIDMRIHVKRVIEVVERTSVGSIEINEALASAISQYCNSIRFAVRPLVIVLCPTVRTCEQTKKAFSLLGFESHEFHGDRTPRERIELQTRTWKWDLTAPYTAASNSPVVVCCSNAAREGIHFVNQVGVVIDMCIVGVAGADGRDMTGFVKYYAANEDSILQGRGRGGRTKTRNRKYELLHYRVIEPQFRGETLTPEPVGALEVSQSACCDLVAHGFSAADYPLPAPPLELGSKFAIAEYLASQPRLYGSVGTEVSVCLHRLAGVLDYEPTPRPLPDGVGLSDSEFREVVEKLKTEDDEHRAAYRRGVSEAFYTLAVIQATTKVERGQEALARQKLALKQYRRLCRSGNPASAARYLLRYGADTAQASELRSCIGKLERILGFDAEARANIRHVPEAAFSSAYDPVSGETVYELETFTPLSAAAASICHVGFPQSTCIFESHTGCLISPIFGRTSYALTDDQRRDNRLLESVVAVCCIDPQLDEGVSRPRVSFIVEMPSVRAMVENLRCGDEMLLPVPRDKINVPTISHKWSKGRRGVLVGAFPRGYGLRPRKPTSDDDEARNLAKSLIVLPHDVVMTALDPEWHHPQEEWSEDALEEYDDLRSTDPYAWRRFCVQKWIEAQDGVILVPERAGGWACVTIACREAWPRWASFASLMIAACQAMSWTGSMAVLTTTQAVATRAVVRTASVEVAAFMKFHGMAHPVEALIGERSISYYVNLAASLPKHTSKLWSGNYGDDEATIIEEKEMVKAPKKKSIPGLGPSPRYSDEIEVTTEEGAMESYLIARFTMMRPSLKKSEWYRYIEYKDGQLRFHGQPMVYFIGRYVALMRPNESDRLVSDIPDPMEPLEGVELDAPLVRIAMKRGGPLPTIPSFTQGSIFDIDARGWSETVLSWARIGTPGIEGLKSWRCNDAPPAALGLFSQNQSAPATTWNELRKLATGRSQNPGQKFVQSMIRKYREVHREFPLTEEIRAEEKERRVDLESALAPLMNLTAPPVRPNSIPEILTELERRRDMEVRVADSLPATGIMRHIRNGVKKARMAMR